MKFAKLAAAAAALAIVPATAHAQEAAPAAAPAAVEVTQGASVTGNDGNPIGTEKFDKKLEWMARLADHAEQLLTLERPVVLAGDYNVIPEDRDTYSVKAMAKDALMQPESRAALRTIVYQGWTDALRAALPDEEKLWTFWDYQRGAWPQNHGFRIDHFLCSPQAADRLEGAGVHKWARGEEKASDHAPVWMRLGK